MPFEDVQFDSHRISAKGFNCMATKLCVWGNSLGARIPKWVVERTAVRPGDYLYITVNDSGEIIIRPVKPRDVHPGYAQATSKGTTKTVKPTVEEKW